MNIYEINEKYENLLNQALSFDQDTPTEEVDDWMALMMECEGDLNEKIDNIVYFKRNREIRALGIEEEIKRLTLSKEKDEKDSERMEKLLVSVLNNLGRTEVETGTNKVQIKKNPASIKTDDDFGGEELKTLNSNIDARNQEIKIYKSDITSLKKESKDKLKKGEKVPGAWLEQSAKLIIK